MKNKIIIALLVIWIIVFSLDIYLKFNINKEKINPTSEVINNDCKGMDLFNTSECLKDQLSTFYKYNLSERDSNYSIERMKEYGAVCWQYSRWYNDNLISLGFKSKEVSIWANETLGHKFTIAYDNDLNHCILDQLNIHCISVG